MAKVKKAQKGDKIAPIRKFTDKDWNRKDSVPSEMFPGKMIPRKDLNYPLFKSSPEKKAAPVKKAPVKKTMKSGGKSFPDLTGDGKVTKADILKGRGVIKHGGKVKMKKGGKMKTCKYGC